jgi:hypothetical protein
MDFENSRLYARIQGLVNSRKSRARARGRVCERAILPAANLNAVAFAAACRYHATPKSSSLPGSFELTR